MDNHPPSQKHRSALLVILAFTLLAVTGCASPADEPELAPTGDPIPTGFRAMRTVDAGGGRTERGGVVVEVPPGAVPEGKEINIALGGPLGVFDSPFATERFERPVRVEHDSDLFKFLTVTWDVTELADLQQHSLILVRWDEENGVWAPSPETITVEQGKASVEVVEFSIISLSSISDWWVDNVVQPVGEALGTRADAPECTGRPLPGWVSTATRPDEGLDGAALRTCYEPDTGDRLTLRVSNNRPYAQRLRTSGHAYDWTWPGNTDLSPEGIVYSLAAEFFTSETSMFLPATHEVSMGFARPSEPGQHRVELDAKVDAVTVSADILGMVLATLPVGGFDNPVLNAFLQVLYECGGGELLSQPDLGDPAQLINHSLRTVQSCTREIIRYDSEFGTLFEDLSRALIAEGGTAQSVAIQANRLVRQVADALIALKAADLAGYVMDQVRDAAAVGPTTFTFTATGQAGALGDWSPTCTNAETDSIRLYRNVALRDEFADESFDLWEFPGWAAAADEAVEPLRACSAEYRGELAEMLPGSWGDSKAASVVAEAIRALGTGAEGGGTSVFATQSGVVCSLEPETTGYPELTVACYSPNWEEEIVSMEPPPVGPTLAQCPAAVGAAIIPYGETFYFCLDAVPDAPVLAPGTRVVSSEYECTVGRDSISCRLLEEPLPGFGQFGFIFANTTLEDY